MFYPASCLPVSSRLLVNGPHCGSESLPHSPSVTPCCLTKAFLTVVAHVYALMPPGARRWVGGACPRLAEAPSAASLLGSRAPAAGDQSAAAGGIAELRLQAPGTALVPFVTLIPVVITFFSVASHLLMSSPDSEL